MKVIHDYIVTDRRDDPEIYFASSDIAEAIRVANEVGYNFLVVCNPDGTIVHDAAFSLSFRSPINGSLCIPTAAPGFGIDQMFS